MCCRFSCKPADIACCRIIVLRRSSFESISSFYAISPSAATCAVAQHAHVCEHPCRVGWSLPEINVALPITLRWRQRDTGGNPPPRAQPQGPHRTCGVCHQSQWTACNRYGARSWQSSTSSSTCTLARRTSPPLAHVHVFGQVEYRETGGLCQLLRGNGPFRSSGCRGDCHGAQAVLTAPAKSAAVWSNGGVPRVQQVSQHFGWGSRRVLSLVAEPNFGGNGNPTPGHSGARAAGVPVAAVGFTLASVCADFSFRKRYSWCWIFSHHGCAARVGGARVRGPTVRAPRGVWRIAPACREAPASRCGGSIGSCRAVVIPRPAGP